MTSSALQVSSAEHHPDRIYMRLNKYENQKSDFINGLFITFFHTCTLYPSSASLMRLNPPKQVTRRSKHPPSGSSHDAFLTRLRQNPPTNTCQEEEEEAEPHSPRTLIRFGESARQLIHAIIYKDRLSDRKVKFTASAGGWRGFIGIPRVTFDEPRGKCLRWCCSETMCQAESRLGTSASGVIYGLCQHVDSYESNNSIEIKGLCVKTKSGAGPNIYFLPLHLNKPVALLITQASYVSTS